VTGYFRGFKQKRESQQQSKDTGQEAGGLEMKQPAQA